METKKLLKAVQKELAFVIGTVLLLMLLLNMLIIFSLLSIYLGGAQALLICVLPSLFFVSGFAVTCGDTVDRIKFWLDNGRLL